MYLNDLNSSQHNVDKLNKILANTFKHDVDLSEMSTDSLNRMLNTTNAKMMAIKESDLKYWENAQYNKLGLIAHQLKTYITEIAPTRTDGKKMKKESTVMEADLDQAEVLLAAQELVDELQGMVEDVAEMQVQKLMPIVDAMKEQVGFEVAEAYNTAADGALGQLLDAMKTAKGAVENATLAARGEPVDMPAPTDMGAEAPAEAPMGADMEAPDEFGGDESEAGEDNAVGRELKGESALAEMEKEVLAEKKFLESKNRLLKMVESGSMTMEHFINVINELKNKYGSEINPAWGDAQKKFDGAPMMGDLGDGKGFREIPRPGNTMDVVPPDQRKQPDKFYLGPPAVPTPKPKMRPDGTPFNKYAPPPTGPGGDEALPKAKPTAKPDAKYADVPDSFQGAISGDVTPVKPMQFGRTADEKSKKFQAKPNSTGSQGRNNRRGGSGNQQGFDLGDMFSNLFNRQRQNSYLSGRNRRARG